MKIINKPRGSGKTTQLIYVSEFNDWPIICMSQDHKRLIQEKAFNMGCSIPEPITVSELVHYKAVSNPSACEGYLVDEAPAVFEALINSLTGTRGRLKGIEMTVPMSGGRHIGGKYE